MREEEEPRSKSIN
jgi:hypothetical protein